MFSNSVLKVCYVSLLSLLLIACASIRHDDSFSAADPFHHINKTISEPGFNGEEVRKELESMILSKKNPKAMTLLANLYMSKEIRNPHLEMMGFTPNKTAFHLYRLASLMGNGIAQFNLGIFYKNGIEIPQDYEQAYYWLVIASYNAKDLKELTKDARGYANKISKFLNPSAANKVENEIKIYRPLENLSETDAQILKKICGI